MGDNLKHYGVPGMKWGVRRYQPYPKGKRNAGKFIDSSKQTGGSSQNGSKSSGIKGALKSKGREISMARAQREIKNLSSKEAKTVLTRSQLENRFKRLSNTPNVGTSKSKKEYLNRENMSNAELKRKVDRLQLADNMRTEARNANPDVIEMGKKVAMVAAPFVVSKAFEKFAGTAFTEEVLKEIGEDTAKAVGKWII